MGRNSLTENQFRDRFIKPLLDQMPYTWYFVKEANSVRGYPDIFICCAGKFVALECKKDDDLTDPRTRLQEYRIKEIQDALGRAWFIYPENYKTVMYALIWHCFSASEARSLMPLLDEYSKTIEIKNVKNNS